MFNRWFGWITNFKTIYLISVRISFHISNFIAIRISSFFFFHKMELAVASLETLPFEEGKRRQNIHHKISLAICAVKLLLDKPDGRMDIVPDISWTIYPTPIEFKQEKSFNRSGVIFTLHLQIQFQHVWDWSLLWCIRFEWTSPLFLSLFCPLLRAPLPFSLSSLPHSNLLLSLLSKSSEDRTP